MPYPAGHRAEVRKRIVRSARELFNRQGFENTSVDAIMAAAGLTRGGFYSYFETKEELFAEAIRLFLAEMPSTDWDGLATNPKAPQILRSVIEAYLSRDAMDVTNRQCPLVAQPNDVARSGPVAKAAYRDVFLFMLRMFENALAASGLKDPNLPYALSSLLVGTMTLARTVGDEKLAKQIRDSGRAMALRLIAPEAKKKAAPRRVASNGHRRMKNLRANA